MEVLIFNQFSLVDNSQLYPLFISFYHIFADHDECGWFFWCLSEFGLVRTNRRNRFVAPSVCVICLITFQFKRENYNHISLWAILKWKISTRSKCLIRLFGYLFHDIYTVDKDYFVAVECDNMKAKTASCHMITTKKNVTTQCISVFYSLAFAATNR